MRSKLAERLAGLVQDAMRGGAHDLPTRLSDAGFTPVLCRLIPMAVALTLLGRGGSAAASDYFDLRKDVDQIDAEDLDGIATAVNYNMINRLSSGFVVSPEFSAWRRPAWLLRLTRRPAAWMLRQAMSFDRTEGPVDSDRWPGKLGQVLEAGGLAPLPGGCPQLSKAPHLAEALCRLFAASTDAASLEPATLRVIDRAVLLQLGAERLLPSGKTAADAAREPAGLQGDERSDACRSFAERLTARPWSITAGDIGNLRAGGLSEAELLDVVFRVAVLNGLGRLERLLCGGADDGNHES